MWASSGDEFSWINDITQDIHEQQLIIRFDYLIRQLGHQIRALILHLLGFGVIVIVGVSLNEI